MRTGGILMHLTSLPSPHGVGAMGAAARHFVDFLGLAGQTWWQMLPTCPTSVGDSPYQTFSTFAGNPYLIDLDDLASEGLLTPGEYEMIPWADDPQRVDYDRLYRYRAGVLALACGRFLQNPGEEYTAFRAENSFWLEDYALFTALKEHHGGAPWQEWERLLRSRDHAALEEARHTLAGDMEVCKAVQFLFFRQWRALKEYANSRGVSLIGDLPIYVSLDSADVWANPGQFQLDENLLPTEVAGCPPDYFSEGGQLWGNPLFEWEAMERDGFSWWTRRIDYQCAMYDMLRIDHFRGFDTYYAIPYGAPDAKVGRWREGPGIRLFTAVEHAIGKKRIIAEDLGFLTPSVHQLREDTGFPGMKVLEFAFDSREKDGSSYLPHNHIKNCVVYTGTHDNQTLVQWLSEAPAHVTDFAKDYLRLTEGEGYHWGMVRSAWQSVADTVIIPMQDLLGLGAEGRMNEPSTVGKNWKWRALPGFDGGELAARLRGDMELYCRLP